MIVKKSISSQKKNAKESSVSLLSKDNSNNVDLISGKNFLLLK